MPVLVSVVNGPVNMPVLDASTTITVPVVSVPEGACVMVVGCEPAAPVLVSVVNGPVKIPLLDGFTTIIVPVVSVPEGACVMVVG